MKQPRRGHSCGKTRYRDGQEAKRALSVLVERSHRDVKPARAYECDRCHGWHLTSQPAPTPEPDPPPAKRLYWPGEPRRTETP